MNYLAGESGKTIASTGVREVKFVIFRPAMCRAHGYAGRIVRLTLKA